MTLREVERTCRRCESKWYVQEHLLQDLKRNSSGLNIVFQLFLGAPAPLQAASLAQTQSAKKDLVTLGRCPTCGSSEFSERKAENPAPSAPPRNTPAFKGTQNNQIDPATTPESIAVLVKLISRHRFEFLQRGTLFRRQGEQWEFVNYTPRTIHITGAEEGSQFKLSMALGETVFTLPFPEDGKRREINGERVYVLEEASSRSQMPSQTPDSVGPRLTPEPQPVIPVVAETLLHTDVIDRLKQLAQLKAGGVITQEEFDLLKSRLLS